MKKFQNLSLLAATFLASMLIYSCMKDEAITQQPVALEQLQAQPISTTSDAQPDEAINKQLPTQVSNAVNKTTKVAQPISVQSMPSSVENDECDKPADKQNCTTQTLSVDINMPATALNPFSSVATVTFIQTICMGPGNQASISYREVTAVPNTDPHPLFLHWVNLPSPQDEIALDEYIIKAANKMEDMMTKQFFQNTPNVPIIESRYYRNLCYTTCLFKVGEVNKMTTTTCGEKCCKRVKILRSNPNGPQVVLIQEYFETSGGVCTGNPAACKDAIKVTQVCSHECEVRLELSEEDK